MKHLAGHAKESTTQVRGILSEIRKGINAAVMLTEEAVKRVESGKEQGQVVHATIEELAHHSSESLDTFQQIIAGTSQQQIGFEQVSQGMQDIRQAAEQASVGTSQLEEAVSSLESMGNQIQESVAHYKVG